MPLSVSGVYDWCRLREAPDQTCRSSSARSKGAAVSVGLPRAAAARALGFVCSGGQAGTAQACAAAISGDPGASLLQARWRR